MPPWTGSFEELVRGALTMDADLEELWKIENAQRKKKRSQGNEDSTKSGDAKRNKATPTTSTIPTMPKTSTTPTMKVIAKQVSSEARDVVERGEFTFDSRPYSQHMQQSEKASGTSSHHDDIAAGPAWRSAIPQPTPLLWEAIHARFHIRNDSVTDTALATKSTSDRLHHNPTVGTVVFLRDAPGTAVPEKFKDKAITITEIHPDRFNFVHEGIKHVWYLDYTQAVSVKNLSIEPSLSMWLSSCEEGEEIKCGHCTKQGRFCNWSAPCGIHHKQEGSAMKFEDEHSRKRDKGICNVKTRQGKICTNVKGECPSHAPDPIRCHSMIDNNHEERCWNFKSEEEGHLPEYCYYHQDFPNLSVNAREYGLTGKVCSEEDFLSRYYPDSGDKKKLPMDSSTLFKKYVALMSDQKELWWVDYHPDVSTEFKTQAQKIVNQLFPVPMMRGDAKTRAARINHSLSDKGSRLRVQTNGDNGDNGDKFMIYISSLNSGGVDGEGVSVAPTVAYVTRM